MKRDIIAGSDHAALMLQLKWTGSCNSVKDLDECEIRIPRVTDYKDFQLKLDELLEAFDWGNLDLEQQRQDLQETLVDVGKATYGYAPRESDHKTRKKITRSSRESKHYDSVETAQLSIIRLLNITNISSLCVLSLGRINRNGSTKRRMKQLMRRRSAVQYI